MSRQLHLNLFIQSRGHHEASWRHPGSSPLALTDIEYFRDLARRAEAGLFDSIFLADTLALMDTVTHSASTWLEPITTLGALAGSTKRIGLIATASTTYSEPFSLDHITGGRVGWNIVTSWLAAAALNYGDTSLVSHDERYERGEEFVAVVKALWDSWADDAVLDDRASGQYARAGRIRPINHVGKYYRVAGPLNMPRGPQGRPVFVQAGSSETGRRFAARHAEAFADLTRAFGLEYYGIDCAETRDGRLVVFEADVGMIVHAMDPAETYPYKKPAMAKIFDAFVGALGTAAEQKRVAA